MLKKIPIPKRHQDTFGGYEYNFTGQRGVMLHTDRYQASCVVMLKLKNPKSIYYTFTYFRLLTLMGISRRPGLARHHGSRLSSNWPQVCPIAWHSASRSLRQLFLGLPLFLSPLRIPA
jgi:hypothetical protein